MSRRYLGGFITANPVTPTASAASGAWTLNQQMQANAAGNWPTGFGDPYFNYTSLLLSTTSLSGANNNLFVDSSGAYNVVNRNGNTAQGSFSPYGSNWSNYFDGSSWLTTSSITLSGDFTVECWALATNTGTPVGVGRMDLSTGFAIVLNSNNDTQVAIFTGNSYAFNANVVSSIKGKWAHIAVVRSSGVIRIYVNGSQIGTTYSNSSSFSGEAFLGAGKYGASGKTSEMNGYVSNVRIVTSAVYTSNFTPPTAPLTAITNTSLLTCQSNRFRDASTSNLTITPNGDVRVTNYAPFLHTAQISYNQSDIQYWSNYLDNSGDYLTCGSGSSAFAFGTGDFTIEGWFYSSFATATWKPMLSVGAAAQGQLIRINQSIFTTGNWGMLYPNDAGNSDVYFDTGSPFPLNQWVHVALVRSGTTLTLYQNGTNVLQKTVGFNFTNTTGVSVGYGQYAGDGTFGGYVSNVRIVKGTAVYTGAFTPPTAPLTAITNTSLLTCQNAAFTDNSTNNFAITINGNTTVTGNNPFQAGYYSNYFDGSGDYLNVATNAALSLGTGDLTCEAWVWVTGGSGNRHIFSGGTNNAFGFYINSGGKIAVAKSGVVEIIASTTTIPLNTWTNVAVSRSGNTFRIFVNGTLEATVTSSQDFTTSNDNRVGFEGGSSAYVGYISNLRVIKGTALYAASFTPSTTPLTAVSGTSLLTCQSNRLIDTSANALAITKNGDVTVPSFDPFYTSTIASNGGSMYFDGSDWLAVPDSDLLDFGTSDFTIEAWVYFPSAVSSTQVIMAGWTAGEPVSGWSLYADSSSFGLSTAVSASYVTATNSAARTPGMWHHVAAVRSSGSVTLYVNGVGGTPVSNTQSVNTGPTGMEIARSPYTANRAYLTGYIATPRITRSAVYTSNFTPPTAPYNPSANTALLVNGMNAGIYDATAINDLETVGDAKVTTAVSKFGGSSMAFDGSGDYLKGSQPSFTTDINGADFTIEFWVNFTSLASDQALVSKYGNAAENNGGQGYVVQWVQSSSVLRLVLGTVAGSTDLLYPWSWSPTTGVWYHVAITRSGTSGRAFINGTQIGTTSTVTTSDIASPNSVQIGKTHTVSQFLQGYMDDVRITRGYARYTANFTPPAAALPTF